MLNKLFLFLVLFSFPVHAHTFTGMIGFYDGISHPVLGLDHFLAMVCVGIVSTQIGGRAIWFVPSCFVIMMIVGGIVGIFLEINLKNIVDIAMFIIELGIVLSVILLGIAIVADKKIYPIVITIFVCIFGIFHGLAHGIEMPWAANPILFSLGFTTGTATLHLFGVGIGSFANRTKFLSIGLKFTGTIIAIYGCYLLLI